MNKSVLRIDIKERWSVVDMTLFLVHVRDLYNWRYLVQIQPPGFSRGALLDQVVNNSDRTSAGIVERREKPVVPVDDELMVSAIRYASPGFCDLAGAGAVIGHLKDFLLTLIQIHTVRRRRALEDEQLEIKNDALRLENLAKFLRLQDEYESPAIKMGDTESFKQHEAEIARLVIAGKICNVDRLNRAVKTPKKRRNARQRIANRKAVGGKRVGRPNRQVKAMDAAPREA